MNSLNVSAWVEGLSARRPGAKGYSKDSRQAPYEGGTDPKSRTNSL
jgi:hypothetical protein